MLRLLLVHFGHHALKQSGATRALDWKLGLRLLRDRRVSFLTKLLAIGIGIGALALLEVLELPLEAALALLVPILGLAADFALDGIELIAVPFFVATLLLPFLAPREVVAELRGESAPQAVPATTADFPSRPNSYNYNPGHVYDATGATIR